jgi:outer membrane protein OmpA-like peptidoglycan-associated protein
VLDSIAGVMNGNPSLEILISGHTDVIGDKQLNYQLSLDRANAVKEYLVGKGILPERIKVEAFGGAKPLASSGREETRRLNRRVEITVIKD